MKFIMTEDKEKQQTVTFKELEQANVWHFYLMTNMVHEKGPFDYQNRLISFLLSNKSVSPTHGDQSVAMCRIIMPAFTAICVTP